MKRVCVFSLIILAVSSLTGIAQAQYIPLSNIPEIVHVPDANLAAAIRQTLEINDSESITVTALQSITMLEAPNRQITDLTGLNHATGLTSLTLDNNQIRDVEPLAGLTNLTHLSLGQNEISNLTLLEGLTNLTQLGLPQNEISDVTSLSALTNLTELNLDRNNISDAAPLRVLLNLVFLRLSYNQISDVEALADLENLHIILLMGNPILDTYPLSKLPHLNSADIEIAQYPPWDINEDGAVDQADLLIVSAALGQNPDTTNPRADVNFDGVVDNTDMAIVIEHLDDPSDAPSSASLLNTTRLANLDIEQLQTQIQILRGMGKGTERYTQVIGYLERLLAKIRPNKTQLLANYPNPFNPETWIPYHLANPSDVQIVIYDTHGVIIRRLELGHQSEGYYTSRSRAAYWDGRNAYGEHVASGIYFYQMQADNISPTRKMIILK